jgi:hypothetical protein
MKYPLSDVTLAFLLKPELCFVNVTDENIILQSGQEIATVEEAQVLCAETDPKIGVSRKTTILPKHIEELFRRINTGADAHSEMEG